MEHLQNIQILRQITFIDHKHIFKVLIELGLMEHLKIFQIVMQILSTGLNTRFEYSYRTGIGGTST